MPIELKTIEAGDGSGFLRTDRVMTWLIKGTANGSAGAGVAVTTAVTSPSPLPAAGYDVFVDTNGQAAFAYVTSRTTTGFNVVLQPTSAGSISAGTFDVLIVA